MESDNLSCEQVSSALTSAGIGNHAVRPQNGRLFPLTAISDHAPFRTGFEAQESKQRLTEIVYFFFFIKLQNCTHKP